MQGPKISWLVKKYNETSYSSNDNYYCGSVSGGTSLSIDFRIWNNRYGLEKVENLSNFNIAIKFYDIEDSTFLDYITVILNNNITLTLNKIGDSLIAILPDGFTLSGNVNDGSEQFNDNYMSIRLVIEIPSGVRLKPNDIKNLNLDVIDI